MRRLGMTLAELLIGMTILSITAGVMTLNGSAVGRKSARREAERVQAYIAGHIRRANLSSGTFWMQVSSSGIAVQTGIAKTEAVSLDASQGCKYTPALSLCYNDTENSHGSITACHPISMDSIVVLSSDPGGQYCITVTDADNNYCNVIIGN